jgi:predicted dehydrogenase
MSDRALRVGVIGTSWWADLEHLPGLSARADVDVAALCGRNPERLAALAAKYGIERTHTDWRRLIGEPGLDVAVIATPNALHHEQVIAALDAGLHVICEKPLALDVAQARELAARADAAGRKTLVFFTHRAVAAAAHVKQLVSDGFLGQPVHVSAAYLTASHLKPGKAIAWRMQRAQAGTGVLGDIGSHLIDLVRWWLGDVTRVAAQWQTVTRDWPGGVADADEDCSFLAKLACGADATFHASKLAAGRGNYQRVELCGTGGTLVYEADPGFSLTWAGRVSSARAGAPRLEEVSLPADLTAGLDGSDDRASRNEAYRRLTDPFFAAIRDGGGAAPDFHDGLAVQAVLDAVARSAEQGVWVDVPRGGAESP